MPRRPHRPGSRKISGTKKSPCRLTASSEANNARPVDCISILDTMTNACVGNNSSCERIHKRPISR